ncbi:Gfo/Idh/MocA family oxidoreductase [Rathayibacter sp. VKM Ac-2754]|uniref:Gfo/Idh/MocA family oxidoreductase n=1 Tax=Rathayibacter sp. VKM Ac-2754 TaxID=2609251 RepID=UPI00135900E7|nr:Gfo/Idh/MocA family oxidoreductase [Rathayibacter sp. VKM Ac-2754]MWV58882.1 gfo/Idh/MocA family oxidoreductase [Rathayibacter sp. VKM Ac-2754]
MPVTLPAPRTIDPSSVPVLRWGIIGTGIADQFVGALHVRSTQRAVAVTARDAEKTREFAERHGIPTIHDSVEALVSDPGVDVVYVSTPHPLHRSQALAAIAAGKHVLIEKPIAMSAEEAREITEAGCAAGVLVMEAMWARYLPQADVIRQVVESGVLGELRLVRADFGFSIPFDPESRLWNASLGGGALLDAGVYPISFASSVIGAPSRVSAAGATHPETGVDSRADLLLSTEAGPQALLSTSLETSLPVEAMILGSEGRLAVHSPFFGPSGLTLTLGSLSSAQESDTWIDDGPWPYGNLAFQATAFASYVAQGLLESPLHPHHEVVSVMETIDEARRQIAGASGAVQHTVAFSLVHETGSAAEAEFLSHARRTLSAIPGVTDFTVNRQVSAKSALDWQFSMVFADRAAFAAYDAHPDHVEFVQSRWVPEVAEFQENDFEVLPG